MIHKRRSFLALAAAIIISINAYADETLVQTLSEGACWYEQGDQLKIVSFNDHEVLMVAKDELEDGLTNLLNAKALKSKKSKKEELELLLHCGGYGASVVVKTPQFCAWMKLDKGQLEIRSFGGREDQKGSGLCDGYKWGELIVGVFVENESQLLGGPIGRYLKNVQKVSKQLYRINLKDEYVGQETTLVKELKNLDKNIKYVELNQYQHPVGEYSLLK